MSKEQLKAFLEKIKGDTSLQEKLKAADDADAVVAMAKDAGFMISADDLQPSLLRLSEADLEVISGAGFWQNSIFPYCPGAGDPNHTLHPEGVACTS